MAERVLASQGWGTWPACSKKIGAKGKATPRSGAAKQAPPAQAPASSQASRTEVKPSAPTTGAPKSLTKAGSNYTVAPGDSLSKIAKTKHVPGGWQAVYERNKDVLSNPSTLKSGQQLTT